MHAATLYKRKAALLNESNAPSAAARDFPEIGLETTKRLSQKEKQPSLTWEISKKVRKAASTEWWAKMGEIEYGPKLCPHGVEWARMGNGQKECGCMQCGQKWGRFEIVKGEYGQKWGDLKS